MGKAKFEEFLSHQQETSTIETVDWNQKKEEWMGYLSVLYEQIENWLDHYIKSGKIILKREPKLIQEERIGEYEVEKLLIKINGETVTLDPIGTNLIGTIGRVDMSGFAGTIRFILVDKNTTSPRMTVTIRDSSIQKVKENQEADQTEIVWKIATSPPHIHFEELNEESFFDALMEVING